MSLYDLTRASEAWENARTKEDKARVVGNDRALLLARLRESRACLLKQYKGTKPRFSFAERRLYLNNGFALQWQLRENPEAPEDYNNQQTNLGDCVLIKL